MKIIANFYFRFCVQPNDGFEQQLREFEAIYRARVEVAIEKKSFGRLFVDQKHLNGRLCQGMLGVGIFKREGGRRRMLMRRTRGSSPGWLTTERTPWRLKAQKRRKIYF